MFLCGAGPLMTLRVFPGKIGQCNLEVNLRQMPLSTIDYLHWYYRIRHKTGPSLIFHFADGFYQIHLLFLTVIIRSYFQHFFFKVRYFLVDWELSLFASSSDYSFTLISIILNSLLYCHLSNLWIVVFPDSLLIARAMYSKKNKLERICFGITLEWVNVILYLLELV